jgi:polyhydroxyalkanoate synthase
MRKQDGAGSSAVSTDQQMSDATVVDAPASRADPTAAMESRPATRRGSSSGGKPQGVAAGGPVAAPPFAGEGAIEPVATAAVAVIDLLWAAHPLSKLLPIDWGGISRALTEVSLRAIVDPAHALMAAADLSLRLSQETVETWIRIMLRWLEETPPGETLPSGGEADRRFDAPEWEQHPFFRLLKQGYLTIADWLLREAEAGDLRPADRQRLAFHLRQLVDATSPTLFLPTNPAALRKALETGGASVADGLRHLLADLRAGRLSITDTDAFAPGRNLALTPGKVVHRSRLIELIQYAPVTEQAHAAPLLFVPPWINKFYILDLQPKNSLVRFLLEQGFSVFMISWKNPDAGMESISFEDYMTEGPLAASEIAREITGAQRVNPIGYCIGGTLLAATLAYLAAARDRRFGPATFMVSLLDFSEVGDTAVFMDEPQVAYVEQQMLERGYLDSRHMANMFNLLRANDLIWSTVVNNYLMGNRPPAFDLLYWNSDGTRMARAAHSFYLRNTYLENNFIKPGKVSLLGRPIDLSRIAAELYAVGAEKDHIVPWRSAWRIARLTRAKTRFVLAASGHIAGMINPPAKGKGGYWTNDADTKPETAEEWLAGALRHEGSWWTDWTAWLAARSGQKRPAPAIGSAVHPPLCEAPGTYVLET